MMVSEGATMSDNTIYSTRRRLRSSVFAGDATSPYRRTSNDMLNSKGSFQGGILKRRVLSQDLNLSRMRVHRQDPDDSSASTADIAPAAEPASGPRKRKQVKNACVNCQKACKKCETIRPCPRCVRYGLEATCTDSVRKERRRGVRGPYRRASQSSLTSTCALETADDTVWEERQWSFPKESAYPSASSNSESYYEAGACHVPELTSSAASDDDSKPIDKLALLSSICDAVLQLSYQSETQQKAYSYHHPLDVNRLYITPLATPLTEVLPTLPSILPSIPEHAPAMAIDTLSPRHSAGSGAAHTRDTSPHHHRRDSGYDSPIDPTLAYHQPSALYNLLNSSFIPAPGPRLAPLNSNGEHQHDAFIGLPSLKELGVGIKPW
ncbi:hypothetical protein HDU85_006766 [Gaertneriomyces sp. JEL0708]|nr:hypothetical protein HDU85_006766 [Gaertneriomyces sp. JEL0708]